MSRYIERAENIARLLDVNLQFLFDFQDLTHTKLNTYWDSLILSTGDEERSEEHTSELQSLMRISYAVFCLKKKNNKTTKPIQQHVRETRSQRQYNTSQK